MAILRQKRGPSNPTNWRRLALATVLRYATPAGQGKTKTSSTSWTLRSPFQAIDWLPFAPPRWLPIPRHSQPLANEKLLDGVIESNNKS